MAMAGVLHLWNEWEIQILVLVSFALQVFLLSFAWMRRRNISRALRIVIWLMYLLAEYTATYTLGHMSIGCKAGEHQQLMAFWAPFLLVHLGGQDTITLLQIGPFVPVPKGYLSWFWNRDKAAGTKALEAFVPGGRTGTKCPSR